LYEALLLKWQKRINLVAPSTVAEARTRHFRDSAQILRLAPEGARHWVDLGSGGGFPGLVCAILCADRETRPAFTMIESDVRKGSFLREVIRQTGIKAQVRTQRIEAAPPQDADIISARALAPLEKLLPLAKRHLNDKGTCLFLKGANHQAELESIRQGWHIDYDLFPSETSDKSVILRINGVPHA
jgi:16S rRNA (guanine527-N7)-methyltransferase